MAVIRGYICVLVMILTVAVNVYSQPDDPISPELDKATINRWYIRGYSDTIFQFRKVDPNIDRSLVRDMVFNDQGQIIRSYTPLMASSGITGDSIVYTYDSLGHLTAKFQYILSDTLVTDSSSVSQINAWRYFNDDLGYPVIEVYYDSTHGTFRDTIRYRYAHGDLHTVESDGRYELYTYNDNGQLESHTLINTSDTLNVDTTTLIYTYDHHNRLTRKESRKELHKYIYDHLNNISGYTYRDKTNDSFIRYHYNYDKTNKLFEKMIYRDRELIFWVVYSYNSIGLPGKEIYIDPASGARTYMYKRYYRYRR